MMKYFNSYLLTFLFISFISNILVAQTLNIDSSITELQKLPEDTSKVSKINDFIWEIKSINPDTAIFLGDKNIELAEKLDFFDGVGYAAKNIGGTYYYLGDYEKALSYYEKSLEYFVKAENKQGIAIGYKNIGNIYNQLGDWKNALDYFLKSMTIREEISDKKGIALVSNSIGLLYINSKQEIDSSLKYFDKALKIYKEIDNQSGVAESYLNIGSYYYAKNDSAFYKNAIENLMLCRNICITTNNVRYLATCDEILGQIYLFEKNFNEAIIYIENSLSLRIEMGNQFGIASSYTNLAIYYIETGDINKAFDANTKANDLAKEIGSKALIRDIYKNFADIYSRKKDFEKAYDYLGNYFLYKDSLESEENLQEMTQLSMQYEFDKKQKMQEIEKQAELKKQRIIIYTFILGLIFTIIFAIFISISYRAKQKANKLLEERNNEILSKNAMLHQQKEEIEAQRDEIEQSRDLVVNQRDKIAKQNKHITDSIVYAQRIQDAILPPKEFLDSIFNHYFVLFKPRDIVSGDFYWATKKDDFVVVTAADCTGHGVPGAFMSMLGVSFLNEIVTKIDSHNTHEFKASIIIDHLKASIMKSLRQTGKDNEAKDGMDMALLIYNLDQKKGQFAGAHNPLILIRGQELTEYKADRMPVGISYRQDEPFVNVEFEIAKDDKFYMFSDGCVDQFGGPEGRKYTSKKFRNFLLSLKDTKFEDQKEIINTEIENWEGHIKADGEKFEQLDDIIIFGIMI